MKLRTQLPISSVLFGLTIMTGCAPKGIHTPASIAGPVALIVANNQDAGKEMCAILMLAPGSSNVDNMLGKTKLPVGGHAEFSVAAGTYRLAIANCEISGDQSNSQKGSEMSGIVGTMDPLDVNGPTYVSVGETPSAPPAGYTVKTLVTSVVRSAVCSEAGDVCEANTNCCSGAQCSTAGRCP